MPYTYAEAGALRRIVRAIAGNAVVSALAAPTLHQLDKYVSRRTGGQKTVTAVLAGLPVVLLTTRGARTGEPRTCPLLGLIHDGRVVVIASNYGKRNHPAWYHNLRANPRAELIVHGATTPVVAREAEGAEREYLWAESLQYYPGWAAYERRAAPRRIPVLVLVPDKEHPTPGRR